MPEKRPMRDAIERLAGRLHRDNQRAGKDVSFEDSQKRAVKIAERRDAEKRERR